MTNTCLAHPVNVESDEDSDHEYYLKFHDNNGLEAIDDDEVIIVRDILDLTTENSGPKSEGCIDGREEVCALHAGIQRLSCPHNLPYEPKVLKSIMLHQELCIVQLSVRPHLSVPL